jgi:hypothetical protein
VDSARDKIHSARTLIFEEEDDRTTEIINDVRQSLLTLVESSTDGRAQDFKVASNRAGVAAGRMDQAVQMSKKMSSPSDMPSIKKRLETWINRIKDDFWKGIQAKGTLYVIRPLLYLVLVIFLAVVGLDTLYINSGATFGANPIGDYLGLVLWGLSADVAGRTLGNLTGKT